MTAGHAIAFLVFATVAAITPGPSNLILTSTGAAVGIRRGLRCLVGVVCGMGLLLFVVAVGLGHLVLARPVLVHVLKACGMVYLLWLAWKIASAGRSNARAEAGFVGFWQAAAFQWVNPKSWLISASAVGTYLGATSGSAFNQALQLSLLFMLAALPSCAVWLAFGAGLQRWLRSERAARWFNVMMGSLLAASVLLLI